MKKLFLLPFLSLMVSCRAFHNETYTERFQRMEVRVTTYWKSSDRWTSRGLTSTGGKLQHMKTCAVDPKTIPYGSKIELCTNPPLLLAANDTGSAVKSRKAAKKMGKDVPVVDVFFNTIRQAKQFIKDNPYFVEAKIYDSRNL